jgi:hypothetical protein
MIAAAEHPPEYDEVPELNRLPLAECRELVGPASAALTNQQIRCLRDSYYTLAAILCRLVMVKRPHIAGVLS